VQAMTDTLQIIGLRLPGIEPALQLRVHTETDIYISASLRREGIWEPYETALVQQTLKSGDTFLDAGANLGYFTVLAAACVGAQGKVYAFEPEPRNFDLLQQNVTLNGFDSRVEAARLALAAQAGVGQLHLHPENLGDHQLYSTDASRQVVTTELVAGAAHLQARCERLDLVKIDTQGAEQEVVQGLLPLLKRSGPTLKMIIELTPYSLRQAGTDGAALIELLQELDLPFAIVDHIEHRLVAVSAAELKRWCNNVDDCIEDEGFMNIFVGVPV
jgi:FkbM family methyltransferase